MAQSRKDSIRYGWTPDCAATDRLRSFGISPLKWSFTPRLAAAWMLAILVPVAGSGQSKGVGEEGHQEQTRVRYEIAWERTLGGPKSDSFNSITATSSGDVVVIGVRHTVGAPPSQHEQRSGWLLRLQANGEEVWNRLAEPRGPGQMLGSASTYSLEHVVPWKDDGYLAVGRAETIRSTSVNSPLLIDYDGWIYAFDDTASGFSHALVSGPAEHTESKPMTYTLHRASASASHGFVAVGIEGFLKSGTGSFMDVVARVPWVLRVGSDSKELWRKEYNRASGVTWLTDAALLPDSSVLLGARPERETGGPSTGLLIRLGLDGNEVWRRTMDNPAGLSLSAMKLIDDEHIVLVGTAELPEIGGESINHKRGGWIGIADLSGNVLTSLSVAGDFYLGLRDIVELRGGGFAAVGTVRDTDSDDSDGFVVTTDERLRETSRNRFGGETKEELKGIAALPDGKLIAAGVRTVDGSTDGWVVALTPHDNGVDDAFDTAEPAAPQTE
ncbi:MAG: hypothetical protein R3E82_03730 [Pseudomonadales bacterium]